MTLRFADGQDSISGTLTEFRDDKFFIQSSIGLVAIPNDGVFCVGAACPEETRLQIESAGVTLTSKDGMVSLSGDLIEIENNHYVIATPLGVQSIAIELVDCEGEGCVSAAQQGFVGGPVELLNGDFVLTGNLIGFDGTTYLLEEVEFGEIRLSATAFECRGEGCP